MKLNIGKKYALYFGIISLAVSAVMAISFLTILSSGGDTLRRKIEETERSIYDASQGRIYYNIADYLGQYLFVPLYQLDIDGINRLIRDMKAALPIKTFLITDPSGKVLTDGTKQNTRYGELLAIERGRLQSSPAVETLTPEGRTITFSVRAGTHIAGYGMITLSDEPLKSAIQRHRDVVSSIWDDFKQDFTRVSLLGIGGVLMIAALLSFLFSRTLSRPLMKLKHAADRVAEGDLSYRVSIDSRDEIGSLADSFNRMVSDLKISTERLQAANEKLVTLDRMKSDFISTLSHELRTPMTSIKAFSELILIKPRMPEGKKTKFLTIIKAESERLARLINDILDLTKIEAGKLSWKTGEVSVEGVIRHSVAGIQPLADDKRILMTIAVEPALPSLLGDEDRLVQVMTNILSNAVKFTPQNGAVRIGAGLSRGQHREIVVQVADTGPGVPEGDLPLIFDKFHRSGNGMTEGTGLGLAIARQIVEHHGGKIWATSEPGAGSTFTFTLPLDRAVAVHGGPIEGVKAGTASGAE